MDDLKSKITNFSIISAYKNLTNTRCKEWDNRELDIIEAFKYITSLMVLIYATSFYALSGPLYNI